jgi:hypothetical protein
MPVWRKTLVYALLVGLLAIHAFAVASMKDLWPFSNYPMYSKLQTDRTFQNVRIVAYSDSDPPRRFVDRSTHLRTQVNRLVRAEQLNQKKLNKLLRDYFRGYEQRDRLKAENVRLVEARVYRLKWVMRPDASNRGEPDEYELVARVALRDDVTLPDLPSGAATRPEEGRDVDIGDFRPIDPSDDASPEDADVPATHPRGGGR